MASSTGARSMRVMSGSRNGRSLSRACPEPDRDARPQARSPSGALVRGIGRDALGLQQVDAAGGVVPRDLLPSRVDDGVHAWHGDRRLGDVGRQDDTARAARREHFVLRIGGQRCRAAARRRRRGVEPAARRRARPDRSRAPRAGSTGRCPPARAGRARPRTSCSDRGRTRCRAGAGRRALRRPGTRRGIATTGAASIVADITSTRRSSRASQACRTSASPRSAWTLRSWNSSSTTVVMSLSSGSCWSRAVRMPSVANSTSCRAREPRLEADVPADFATERPALLIRDAACQRARRGAPRLQDEHPARRLPVPAAPASSCRRPAPPPARQRGGCAGASRTVSMCCIDWQGDEHGTLSARPSG